jgi:hypothetical protein
VEVFEPASTWDSISSCMTSSSYSLRVDPTESTVSEQFLYCYRGVLTSPLHRSGSYPVVACVFVAAGMCLPSSCLGMDLSSDFTIPAFGHHVTVFFCLTALGAVQTTSLSSLNIAALLNNILSRVLVTNNVGSGLDERVYLLLIHTSSNYTYL